MKHRYFAKPDHVVHYPGPRQSGQIHNYVGRTFTLPENPKALVNGRPVAGAHRANKDAFEIDSGTNEAADLMRSAQHGGLWPADADTAAAIGVPFTKLKYDEQAFEWCADEAPAAKPAVASTKPATQSE